ncbi:unnamed protein product [Pieris macdunnoughi]|uniref:Uncharacterized protein n=1 Tax=Pieris macdunnoughi TaxID=345717 RepID=A0A821N9H5_9NEOP|nr:unnamed protein product [Pieris macdunnoughi]
MRGSDARRSAGRNSAGPRPQGVNDIRRYVDIQLAAQGLIKVSIAFKSRTPLGDIFGDIEPSPLPTTSLLGEAPRFA